MLRGTVEETRDDIVRWVHTRGGWVAAADLAGWMGEHGLTRNQGAHYLKTLVLTGRLERRATAEGQWLRSYEYRVRS